VKNFRLNKKKKIIDGSNTVGRPVFQIQYITLLLQSNIKQVGTILQYLIYYDMK